ncbi:hypothetical protein LEMLEM_LOCUS16562 [Lemmus lemmus]
MLIGVGDLQEKARGPRVASVAGEAEGQTEWPSIPSHAYW